MYAKENKSQAQHPPPVNKDQRPNVQHHGIIWFLGTGSEVDTGIDFDYDTAVQAVRVEVVTADTGGSPTLDVGTLSGGTAGDLDGFCDGIVTDTAGYITEVFATRGALLDDDTDIYMMGHVVKSADEQCLTYTSSGTVGAGYIHFYFTRLR